MSDASDGASGRAGSSPARAGGGGSPPFLRRIAFGFGVSVVLVSLLGGLSLLALRRSVASDRLAFQEANEIVEFGALRSVFERKMSAFRSFLATAQDNDLAEMAAARAELLRLLRDFQTDASASERPYLSRVAGAEETHEAVLQKAVAQRRSGVSRDLVAVYLVRESGPLRQAFEAAIDRFLAVRRATLREAALRSQGENALTTGLILAVTVVAAGVVLLLGVVLSRQLAGSFSVERRQRRRAEDAEGRSAFLSRASEVLGSSLDYRQTLAAVAQLAIPVMADWCFVDMVENEGVVRVAVACHAEEHASLARALGKRRLLDPAAPQGPPRVLRTGRSEILADVTDAVLQSVARSPEDRDILRRMRIRSSVCVPIRVQERTVGLLTFCAETSGRYGADDLRLAEDLARRAGVAIDNARLYRDAQEAVRLRDDFLSIASHELKTPLTTLQLQIQAITRRVDSGDATPERLSGRLGTAERQIERLGGLINNLLDISRITSGQLELEPETVNLETVARETLARFAEALDRSHCPVSLAIRGGPLTGRWDRTRVEQVVTNLLSNAAKYGSGRPIEITLSGGGEFARLAVRDHGIGIAPESQARIFDRFERAASSRHYGGLGLGLWIVRQIVEAMGGRVSVESRPGEGSVFTVELPREGIPEQAPAATVGPAPGVSGT